ncbi:MAG: S41 family peptidase [Patescibacteria group bacterium]|nr:S41 family peptidase [Patescibacteria group bacterium]
MNKILEKNKESLRVFFRRVGAVMHWHALKNIAKRSSTVIAGIFIVASLVGSGFYFGYSYGAYYPKNIVIKDVSNIEPSGQTNVDFSVFWQAWDMLKSNYLKGATLKDQDMVYGAIDGLVNSTGDPHTVFMRPDDYKKFEQDIAGEFGGIGAELEVKDNYVVVLAPLDNTPASRGGIKAGDKILAVDGKPLSKPDANEAVKVIRGAVGTKVTLTLLSDGDTKPHDITLTRATIETPTVKWSIKDKDIAYIQLFSFNEQSPYLFYKAAMEIMSSGAKGMVLDLRDDPGGYLEAAVNISGWFFDKGTPVVSERFRNGSETKFTANGTAAFKNMPMVVLVNQGSASASEILAGALRDDRNVKLVGETTFGKGTVQDLEPLKDGSQIKMTIAQWVMPKGGIIEKNGLKPDIEVKITDADAAAKNDVQLNAALQEVQKMISN